MVKVICNWILTEEPHNIGINFETNSEEENNDLNVFIPKEVLKLVKYYYGKLPKEIYLEIRK